MSMPAGRAPNRTPKPSTDQRSTHEARWSLLTWDDLSAWADSATLARGRKYQARGAVARARFRIDDARREALEATSSAETTIEGDAVIKATVLGTRRYSVTVELSAVGEHAGISDGPTNAAHGTVAPSPRLRARCNCSGDANCRHAVAAVLEILSQISSGKAVMIERRAPARPRRGSARGRVAAEIGAQRDPERARLVSRARSLIRSVTKEHGWQNYWRGTGFTPDYSELVTTLTTLVGLRFFEDLVGLGRDLMRRGITQIEHSGDEGETAAQVEGCMKVVFDALVLSELPSEEKLRFAFDAMLLNSYSTFSEGIERILALPHAKEAWSLVADETATRLDAMPSGRAMDFSSKYARSRINRWLIRALERSGRESELERAYESEARVCDQYQPLVEWLLSRGREADARRWALLGIEITRATAPGIASALRIILRDRAARSGDHATVAAHVAFEFFNSPTAPSFQAMMVAAESAGHAKVVRRLALEYLETGEAPIPGLRSAEASVHPGWPLPLPPELMSLLPSGDGHGAAIDASTRQVRLVEIALMEGRLDDARRLFDSIPLQQSKYPWVDARAPRIQLGPRVAAAMGQSRPEVALKIWNECLVPALVNADEFEYLKCGSILREMRTLFKVLDHVSEWESLLATLREEFKRRTRFMKVLDEVEGKIIVRGPRR